MGPARLEFIKKRDLSTSQKIGALVKHFVDMDHEDYINWIIAVSTRLAQLPKLTARSRKSSCPSVRKSSSPPTVKMGWKKTSRATMRARKSRSTVSFHSPDVS